MYTYEYICMYSLSYHSTTTHWNICIWCVKNCKDIPCLNFRAICSCIPGQGLKALNPSPENWTARHNGKETTVTVSLSADLAQEPLCQIPRRCHWFLVLDLTKKYSNVAYSEKVDAPLFEGLLTYRYGRLCKNQEKEHVPYFDMQSYADMHLYKFLLI